MMRENQKKLNGLIQEVMDQMHSRKYGRKTCSHYRSSFRLLMSVSHDTGEDEVSEKRIKAFLDSPVSCCGKWAAKEQIHRQRCIRLLLSLAQTGNVDWGRQKAESVSAGLENGIFRSELERFSGYLKQEGFSPNTICGYRRIVTAFIQWQFTTNSARTKLVFLYPKFELVEGN